MRATGAVVAPADACRCVPEKGCPEDSYLAYCRYCMYLDPYDPCPKLGDGGD